MISKYFLLISNSQVYFFCKSKALNVRMQCFKINFNRLHIFVYLFLNYYEMAVPKKYSTDKKKEPVQEPVTEYLKVENSTSDEDEEFHPILIQLLEKAKRESKLGLGISQEEAMLRIKEKYPFLK